MKVCLGWMMAGVLVAVVLSPVDGIAQTPQIVGRVTDPTGAVLPDTEVVGTNTDTGLEWSTRTNGQGIYRLLDLPPGTYNLRISRPSFRTMNVQGLTVQVGQVAELNATLRLGAVVESVTVEAGGIYADTQTSEISTVVDQKFVHELPLIDRTPLNLINLEAGTTQLDSNRGSQAYVISGQRANANNFTLDGMDNNVLTAGAGGQSRATGGDDIWSVVTSPNSDVVKEFRISTALYTAEGGRASGGLVSVITKSGTNDFHGNVREFFRNRKLNANSFEANAANLEKEAFDQHQFGGQIGGPLQQDRAFFFVDFEALRQTTSDVALLAAAPVSRWAQGDFNELSAAQALFPGGQVPVSLLDPIALRYLELVPDSEDPIVETLLGERVTGNEVTARVDYRINERSRLSASYVADQFRTESDGFATGLGIITRHFGQSFSAKHSHSFSATTLNEFHVGFNRAEIENGEPDVRLTPSDLGFSGVNVDNRFPNLISPPGVDLFDFDFLTGELRVLQVLFSDGGTQELSPTVQVGDHFSVSTGKHLFKTGTSFRFSNPESVRASLANGFFSYDSFLSFVTGSAILDFALGEAPGVYIQRSISDLDIEQDSSSFYFQDHWQARPGLAFDFGLRYEYVSPLVDAQDRISAFRAGAQSTVIPAAPEGMIFIGDTDPLTGRPLTRSTIRSDRNNFAPRVGVAFTPQSSEGPFTWLTGGAGELTIRAGYGVYYAHLNTEAVEQFMDSQPFVLSSVLIFPILDGGTLSDPYGSLANPFPFSGNTMTIGARQSFLQLDPFFETPYAQQFALSIQRRFLKNYLFEISYVGSTGRHLLRRRDINPALLVGVDTDGDGVADAAPSRTNEDLRRPIQGYRNITLTESASNSSYNSLQVKLQRAFAGGLIFRTSYTFGKSIDENSSTILGSNTQSTGTARAGVVRFSDPSADRGRSDYDQRHKFSFSYVWELPWSENREGPSRHLLDGWQLSGIASASSGLPFSILQGAHSELSGVTALRRSPDLIGTYRRLNPREEQTITLDNGSVVTGRFFFDPRGLVQEVPVPTGTISEVIAAARFGNLGRNVFTGGGMSNIDLGITKFFEVTETQNLEFRAEFFNVLNHARFTVGNVFANSGGFAQSREIGNPRLVQLALRYNF